MMHATIGDNSTSIRNNDWVAVYRNLRTHPIIGFLNTDGSRRKNAKVCQSMAWIDLCMEANWKDRHENNNGQLVLVERGQLQGGRKWLADRWGWTEEQVRWFLKKLQDEGMILVSRPKITQKSHTDHTATTPKRTTKSPRFVNLITVCNYNIYQAANELYELLNNQSNPQTNPQITPKQPPHSNKETRKQDNTPDGVLRTEPARDPLAKPKKARKKSPVPETYSEDFEEFWKLYPYKRSKGDASKAWERLTMAQKRKAYLALKRQLHELEARMRDTRGNFCPYPASWLNKGGFDDEHDGQPPPGRPKTKDEMTAAELQAYYDRGGV